ncbi:UxaA family hydrolase [Desulfallas sp. Bu1-1]|jgi:altronate dehydratase small subunit|uniref:UxaA family hydrolase n=1 Tax=Desulfallas sp. Bu1-1 TaxID=2787620 RepID=UPI00189D78B7|nr:UxaA family hydrolase [Desulfallas sp. Bu1-1]MBF7084070.1 UxaA family hydrolase [Desulfallas sp. Bu1-1]
MPTQAVVIDEKDNVATATTNLKQGSRVKIFLGSREIDLAVNADIPFGHKFAIREIGYHEHVIKYGEPMGRATQVIRAGDHVHVHNVESERCRGDWEDAKNEI